MSKLRILCLHGFAQNEISFRKKTATLARSVDTLAEFVYVRAPNAILPPDHTSVSRREQDANINISGETRSFCWWYPLRYKKRLSDGTCEGTAKTFTFLKTVLAEQGPFDGIFGFSQGACLAACLSVMLENRTIMPNMISPQFQHPSLKFVIIAAGFSPVQQEAFQPLFMQSTKIKTPSLHMIGELDTLVLPEQMNALASSYYQPTRFVHAGGHFVPSGQLAQKELATFLSRFL